MAAQFRSLVKNLLISAVLALSASAAANAATIQLRASLDGEQVPLAVPGTGFGVVTFDTVTKVVTWNVSYQGLSGSCTAVHFHGPAPAGVDAGIAVAMTCSASPLTGSTSLNAMQEAQLLSEQWYINIHTAAHGGGEIRGQVVRLRGDFNGDGKADILWRNSASGENYLYPMDGTAILPGEGYLRTVADQSWRIAGVSDFNGDGTADILWRNSASGENYLYLMSGTSIIGEGYLRTVADQSWRVAGVGDFNADGAADILWRNSATGENYTYFMSGTTIAGEGYLRTVPQASWQVQYPSWQAAPPGTAVTLGPIDDNTIYEDQTANSNGEGRHFFAGRTAGRPQEGIPAFIRRALLKFDLASSIPAGSTITSATLTLRVVNTGPAPGAHSMTLHRLQADWGEGTSNTGFGNEGQGAPATTNDATWLSRFFPNSLWTTAGGDFVSTPSATTAVGGISDIGDYSWSDAGMTADVQQWLAQPVTNFGWLLRGDESTTGSAKQFASKENATPTNRPRLVIRYTPP